MALKAVAKRRKRASRRTERTICLLLVAACFLWMDCLMPKNHKRLNHFSFLYMVDAAASGNSTSPFWFWKRRKKDTSLASKIASTYTDVENDLQDRWEAMEKRFSSTPSLKERLSETVADAGETVEYHAKRAKNDIQSMKDRFAREILKQRRGWSRWYRTIHNHLGFMVGALVTFAGGVTLAATKRDVIFLIGVATWTVLHIFNQGEEVGIVEEVVDATKEMMDASGNNLHRTMKQFGRAVKAVTGSFLFKDVVSLAMCVYVSRNSLPEKHQRIVETTLPLASLGFHVFRTVRKIVKVLRKQDKREEQHKRPVRRLFHPITYFTTSKEQIEKKNKQKVTIYTVASFSFVTMAVGILTTLPGITLNMVAASVAGSHLMFDCLSDEVIGNWLSMIQHMDHDNRKNVLRQISHNVYKELRKQLIYPAEAALEEIDEALTGNHDKTNNVDLHERIHKIVDKNLDLKIAWLGALYGVLAQVVWINFDFLRSKLIYLLPFLSRTGNNNGRHVKKNR